MKRNIFNLIFVSTLLCGIFCGCYERSRSTYHWGRTSNDLVGVWKACGTNYGKYYKSSIVDISTIKTLKLEVCADGTFRAINWPFENWQTGEVEISPVFNGTWRYRYSEKDRYGVLTLSTEEEQPFNCAGGTLSWKAENRDKTLRVICDFDMLFLEKVEPVREASGSISVSPENKK